MLLFVLPVSFHPSFASVYFIFVCVHAYGRISLGSDIQKKGKRARVNTNTHAWTKKKSEAKQGKHDKMISITYKIPERRMSF